MDYFSWQAKRQGASKKAHRQPELDVIEFDEPPRDESIEVRELTASTTVVRLGERSRAEHETTPFFARIGGGMTMAACERYGNVPDLIQSWPLAFAEDTSGRGSLWAWSNSPLRN